MKTLEFFMYICLALGGAFAAWMLERAAERDPDMGDAAKGRAAQRMLALSRILWSGAMLTLLVIAMTAAAAE